LIAEGLMSKAAECLAVLDRLFARATGANVLYALKDNSTVKLPWVEPTTARPRGGG